MRLSAVLAMLAAAVVVALGVTATAGAHDGGRVIPVATLTVRESGPLRALVDLRLQDEDGGGVVKGAVVKGFARMTDPHTMLTYFDSIPEVLPGRYRGEVQLPMTARWTVELEIGGEDVVPRTVRAQVVIARSALTESRARAVTEARGTGVEGPPVAAGRAGVPAPPTVPAPVVVGTVQFPITSRDVVSMVVLWVHGLAALAWLGGLALLLVAAATGSRSLLPTARRRLVQAFARWGLPVLWLAAAAVVGTGVYNILRVTPLELAWTPTAFGRLSEVPYGKLYEALLLAKLGAFALLLLAGLGLVRRARAEWSAEPAGAASEGAACQGACRALVRRLGMPGLLFVAAAPAIAGLVVALRYVHILSHVAEAAGG